MENGNASNLYKGLPIYVLQALSEARADGRHNMFDKGGVTQLCIELEHRDAAAWLFDADNSQYMEALNAFPEWEREQLSL